MRTGFTQPGDPKPLVFLLALVLRVVYFVQGLDNPLLSYPVLDEAYYIDLGRAVSGGLLIGEKKAFFMDPLYGYVLAFFFYLFGEDLLPVRIFQILLDSFSAVLVCHLGTAVWNRRAGLVAGVCYAIYRVAFFYTLLILKTTLSISLLLLFMWGLISAGRSRKPVPWFLLGLLGAVLVYLHASFLLLLPLSVLFYGWVERPGWRLWLRSTVFFAAGAVLILSAGAVRNYWVTGEVIWLNTQSGRLFYSSNNPENLTGRYNVPSFSRAHPEESETDFQREAERRLGRRLSAREASAYWREETLRFLRGNPLEALLLLKNKMKETLADYEIPNNHSFDLAARFSEIARWPMPTFALVLAMGLPGLLLGLARGRQVMWLALPLVAVLTTVGLFYSSSRFRMPAVPFLIIAGGIGIDTLLEWCKTRRALRAAAVLVAGLLLFLFSFALSDPRESGTEEFFLARAYWSQKRYDSAQREAQEGAVKFPHQARFPALLGMVALSEGRYEDAARHTLAALAIDPGYADAHHNLGLVYLLTGRAEEAWNAVNRALALAGNPRYLYTLARACEASGRTEEALQSYQEYLRLSKPTDPYRKSAVERLEALQAKG